MEALMSVPQLKEQLMQMSNMNQLPQYPHQHGTSLFDSLEGMFTDATCYLMGGIGGLFTVFTLAFLGFVLKMWQTLGDSAEVILGITLVNLVMCGVIDYIAYLQCKKPDAPQRPQFQNPFQQQRFMNFF